MTQVNKQHELTINISPQSRTNIITNTTFFSMDVKTGKKIINFTHENEPVDLTDAVVILGFEFVGVNSSKIIDSEDGSIVIEDGLAGRCNVILPNHLYQYEGQVLVHVYITFEDGRSLDCGVVVTEFEESWLDSELDEMSQFYVKRFEDLKRDILERAADIEGVLQSLLGTIEDIDPDEINRRFDLLQQQIDQLAEMSPSDPDYFAFVMDTPWGVWIDEETGVVWRVLATTSDARGGVGNALLITENTHEVNTAYHSDVGFTPFELADVKLRVLSWHDEMVSDDLKSKMLDYEFQDSDGNSISKNSTLVGAGIEVDREVGSAGSAGMGVPVNTNIRRGHTRPLAAWEGTPEPFILSVSEANEYFTGNTGPRGRATNASSWTRSPSSNMTSTSTRHAIIAQAGGFSLTNAVFTTMAGIRPAMWVRP